MIIGNRYEFKFYDHSQIDNFDISETERMMRPTVITIVGTLIGMNELMYVIELVKCSEAGNALVWQVLASTIISVKEI